jgi:hypothetical protein
MSTLAMNAALAQLEDAGSHALHAATTAALALSQAFKAWVVQQLYAGVHPMHCKTSPPTLR